MTTRRRVLMVSDRRALREDIIRMLDPLDVLVQGSERSTAVAMVDRLDPEIVIADGSAGHNEAVELLMSVNGPPDCRGYILLVSNFRPEVLVQATRAGVTKVIDAHDSGLQVLQDEVLDILARLRVRRNPPQRVWQTRAIGSLVGSSDVMKRLFERVATFCFDRSTILVEGESGTGKELVARTIHACSTRNGAPFVPINCTAISENLLESELFGHRRGSFTGAVADRRGAFAAAGDGIVFLDEIGDTSAAFQKKILRVLQDRAYCPVGSHTEEEMRARVIVATHRDLRRRVREGRFRQDLYYRVNVNTILIPPLRDRMEDVPALAVHFADRMSARVAGRQMILEPKAVELLMSYHWPGNVRELENTVARAAALARLNVIMAGDIELDEHAFRRYGDAVSLDCVVQKHVQSVLRMTAGNKSRAADKLGISRKRLDRIIQKPLATKAGESR